MSNISIDSALSKISGDAPQDTARHNHDLLEQQSKLAEKQLAETIFLFDSRKKWSRLLFYIILSSVVFQFLLIVMVGFELSSFSKHSNFFSVVMGGIFAQVISLTLVVLKWLFGGKRPDEMLQERKII